MGHLTGAAGVETALLVSAGLMLASPLLGLWLPMPRIREQADEAEMLQRPKVRLALTGRSGPLVVEIEYRITPENARAFHNVMQEVQLFRKRNGAYRWSIARNIADPEVWTERYHCPTWLDYLRQRNRSTQSERARWIDKPWLSTLVQSPCGCDACWSGHSGRCDGKKTRPTGQGAMFLFRDYGLTQAPS